MENNILIITSIIGIIFIIIAMCYFVWSNPDRPGGPIFFVKGMENRIMYIMYGNKFSGRVILPSKSYYIDEKNKIQKVTDPSQIQKSFLGMYWMGLWPFYSIYFRKQEWQEWQLDKENNKNIIVARDESTPYLIAVSFEYAIKILEAEGKGNIPFNVDLTIIVKPTDVLKPIFLNDSAYGQLQKFVVREALLFIKGETFESLGSGEIDHEEIHDRFSQKILDLNTRIPGTKNEEGIIETLGYEILAAEISSIEISGKNKDAILEASTAKYVAEKEAEATIVKAEASKIAGKMGIDVEKYNMDIRNKFYELIKDKPYAQQIELAKKIFSDSNLTTFVSGKDVLPNINLNKQ